MAIETIKSTAKLKSILHVRHVMSLITHIKRDGRLNKSSAESVPIGLKIRVL